MNSNRNDYWLTREPNEVANYLMDFHAKWSVWSQSPFRQAWVRNMLAYYSPVLHPSSWDTSLIFEGVQGELVRMYTPQARVLVSQLTTIVTKSKLAAQCVAETNGDDVIADIKLGNALASQIIDMEKLDSKGYQLVEGSIVAGIWFTKTCWRTDMGEGHAVADNGSVIQGGEASISIHGPLDVYYDVSVPLWDEKDWVEVRTQKNRFNLIAQHPEMAQELMAIDPVSSERGPNTWFDRAMSEEDYIYVYELYAKPSPTLPRGRYLVYASDKCVLVDGDNPYGCIPVEPMCPEPVLGTGLGYPQLTNLLACQEMLDNGLSSIATNQSQFAVQSVAAPRGAGLDVKVLDGMRFISYTPQNIPGGGKPEPMQLSASSPQTFQFIDVLEQQMLKMSNINGALRGSPPPGVTSGVAIATLSANAIEFTSSIAKAYASCMERTIMHALNAYKKMSRVPHKIAVHGRNNQTYTRDFGGEDLAPIRGVKINIVNPLLQTIAGRVEVAEKLMSMPRDIWPEYVSVLEGRPLSDIYRTELSQEDLIQAENERLLKGEQTPVLVTDDHAKHMRDHAGLLNDPNVRINGQSNDVITEHILEHYQMSLNEDPFFAAMIRTGKRPEGGPQEPMIPPAPSAPPGGGGMQRMGPGPVPIERPGGAPQRGPRTSPDGMPTPKVAPPAADLVGRQ